MPELPEVETVVRQLRSVILHKKIAEIEVLKAKSLSGDQALIIGEEITEISRRAKIIRIHLANEQNIVIHLKMSGQLIYVDGEKRVGGGHPTPDWVNALPSSHTRVVFTFDDRTKLFFNDQRIFGWIKIVTHAEVENLMKGLAPDIIDPAVTAQYLFQKAAKRKMPIKQFIMDNQIVAGVGNIYACDSLNLAKISPLRPASSIPLAKMDRLLHSMREVIDLGITLGGATADGKYVHVSGLAGKYQDVMRVYSKKGNPCPNCGAMIIKIKLGGRGTYYCPNCQK
jgi:formamidopyrimidine-DNA glycosylase